MRETVCYVPFDVSIAAVKKSAATLMSQFPGIRIHGIVADFHSQLDVIPTDTNKLFCFLGSTIGNFSMPQSSQFLNELSNIMHAGDELLLGFDMVKDIEILHNAYNDSQKITEQFNKNILNVINNIILTDFDPELFEHVAFYNEQDSRIEMHLKALRDIQVSCPRIPTPIRIKKGEMIHTENSYKFTNDDITTLASNAGLDIHHIFSDKKNWFSLVHLLKT